MVAPAANRDRKARLFWLADNWRELSIAALLLAASAVH